MRPIRPSVPIDLLLNVLSQEGDDLQMFDWMASLSQGQRSGGGGGIIRQPYNPPPLTREEFRQNIPAETYTPLRQLEEELVGRYLGQMSGGKLDRLPPPPQGRRVPNPAMRSRNLLEGLR